MTSKALDLMTRITMIVIFPMLIIALIIYLSGFRGPIQFDATYYNFMQNVAIRASSWNIKIPNIPQIPKAGSGGGFFTAIINFVNFLIKMINVLIMVVNMVISMFVTIGAIVSLLFDFEKLAQNSSSSGGLSYWVNGCLALV